MKGKTAATQSKQKRSIGEIYSRYGTIVILLVLIVVSSIVSPSFLSVDNLMNVMRQIAVIAIIGFGTTFVMVVGGINIAYDAMLALVGCLGCIFYVNTGSAALALLLTIFTGALIGLMYGSLVTVFKLPPFIVGLAVASICQGIVLVVTNAAPVQGIMKTSYSFFGQGYVGPIPTPIVITLIIMAITSFVLRKTTFGRHAVAVGGNRNAAIASGICADNVVRWVYVLDGCTLAIASVVFMSRLGSGRPDPGTGYGFDAITGVVVGGASLDGGSGGAMGTMIGVLIVGVLNNIMNLLGLNAYWQSIAKGIMIILAVIIDIKTKQSIVKGAIQK